MQDRSFSLGTSKKIFEIENRKGNFETIKNHKNI